MHPFSKIYALFQIDAKTLYNWCRRCGIVPHIDPIDNRRRYLDNSQLITLVRLHQRVVVMNNVYEMMLKHIEALNRKIAEIEANLHNKKGP